MRPGTPYKIKIWSQLEELGDAAPTFRFRRRSFRQQLQLEELDDHITQAKQEELDPKLQKPLLTERQLAAMYLPAIREWLIDHDYDHDLEDLTITEIAELFNSMLIGNRLTFTEKKSSKSESQCDTASSAPAVDQTNAPADQPSPEQTSSSSPAQAAEETAAPTAQTPDVGS